MLSQKCKWRETMQNHLFFINPSRGGMHGFSWLFTAYYSWKSCLILNNKLASHPQTHTHSTTAPSVSYPCLTSLYLFMISSSNKLKIYFCASPAHSHKHIVTMTHKHMHRDNFLIALSRLSIVNPHKLSGMPAHTLVFYHKATHGHVL